MSTFYPEQRWYSVMEPELGLGTVTLVEGRTVEIYFPIKDLIRKYEIQSSPLARVYLSPGHLLRSRDGIKFSIESVTEKSNHYYYHGKGQCVHERDLCDDIDVSTPENRLKGGNLADYRDFDLRLKANILQSKLLKSKLRGFGGVRMELFDHQIYIADEASKRHQVRLLLADEVGLGKTIEAALILHKMLLTGRIAKVLIIIPPALTYQWFVELLKRFNLIFQVIDRESIQDAREQEVSIFEAHQLFLCPSDIAQEINPKILNEKWDMLIVDEAHHIGSQTPFFATLKKLSQNVAHLLLLSATPEQSGQIDHFYRLQLLDPARFYDFDLYQKEQHKYKNIANTAKKLHQNKKLNDADTNLINSLYKSNPKAVQEILKQYQNGDAFAGIQLQRRLLDLHGIGRLLFRNVRATIEGFPKRKCHGVKLSKNTKQIWLQNLIAKLPDEKIVVICQTKKTVKEIITNLNPENNPNKKIARFHEDMSLMERDRQAAWFFEETGPKILISSPIGAEGRNFQCAHTLVLWDLPKEPEQLEQRIGRLDRIGQGSKIDIYVPYLSGSADEKLFQWYHKALNAFEKPWHGSQSIMQNFGAELQDLITKNNSKIWNDFLNKVANFQEKLLRQLEQGRDTLLELNSNNPEIAAKLRQAIIDQEDHNDVEEFMIYALDRGGIDAEEIDFRTYNLKPNMFYTKPFPGFNENGMVISFNRELCLKKDDASLLSWDHAMVRDTLDQILTSDCGNASSAKMAGNKQAIILELLFSLESSVASHLRGERFLPPTPISVVINQAGKNCSDEYPNLNANTLEDFNAGAMLQNQKARDIIDTMINAGRKEAQQQVQPIINDALDLVNKEITPQIERLTELQLVNPSINNNEITALKTQYQALNVGLSKTRLRLDALRLIAIYPKQ